MLIIDYYKNFLTIQSFRTKIIQLLLKDRNQPGSHRFELKSCKILKVEQTFR